MFSEITSTDIPSPPGVLNDAEAESIRAHWDSVPLPDREFFGAHLAQYDAFRESAPRQVDLHRKAKQVRTLEDLAFDFDRATLGNGIIPKSVELAVDNVEAQKAKEALTVDTFIRQRTGKPPAEAMRPVLRDAVARDMFGETKGLGSDSNFFTAAKEWAIGRRAERALISGPDDDLDEGSDAARESSLFSLVSAAAMRGEPFSVAYSAWQATAQTKPGFSAAKLADYEADGKRFHGQFLAAMEKARPVAEKVFAGLQSEQASAGAYGGDALIDELRSLPKELRPIAMAMVSGMAEKEGAKKPEGGQFLQAFGRGTAGLLVGTARTMESETLDEAEAKLETLKPGDEFGGRFPDLWSYLRGKSADGVEQQALKFLAEPLLTDKKVTAEDIAAAKERIATERDRLTVNLELEQAGKALLDPIKGKGWLQEKIILPFAESMLPQMAMFAITRKISPAAAGGGFLSGAINLTRGAGAMVPLYGMLADQNAQQLLALNPGMEVKQAYRIGREASVAQTGLEMAQMLLAFGTGSKLGQALKTAQASAWKTFGKSLAVGAIGQNAMEGAQDLLTPIVQALHADAPGVPWEDFFQGKLKPDGTRDESGYWTQRASTFWAVLPAVVFGAGGSTMRARASRGQLEAVATGLDDVTLHAAGIPAEQRRVILAESDAISRLDAFSVALKGADKVTAAEGAARMQKQRQAAEGKFSEEMKRSGVTLERAFIHDEPVFKVTAPGGTVTHHAKVADAMAAVTGHLDAEFVKVNKPAMDMLAALQERPGSPTEQSLTKITARQDSAADALLAAEEAGNTDLADAMKARMTVEQAGRPDSPIDWQKMSFPGQSELDVKEGLLRAVTRIEAGGSALTPLEERAETDAAAWVDSGELTWEELTDMIREVEAVTGDAYLSGHTGGQNAAQDQLATVEGYSLLTRLYATGQGRSGAVGAAARSERAGAQQRLKEAERSGTAGPLMNRLRAAFEWFRELMMQAARLNKARREGKLGDIESFLQRSVGIEEDVAHARAVQNEAKAIYGKDATGAEKTLAPAINNGREGGRRHVQDAGSTPSIAEGVPGEPGTTAPATGFSLSPTATLDAVAEALETRMARDPDARRKMTEKAQEALARLKADHLNDRSEREAMEATERTIEAQAAAEATLQTEHDDRVAALETGHESQAAAMVERHDTATDELRARQDLDTGAAADEGWSRDRRDALNVRHGREHDRMKSEQARERTAMEARQRRELDTLANRQAAGMTALRTKHERAAEEQSRRQERGEQRATMMRNLRILDAVLAAFPADVRGKVGGWVPLARLTTETAMAKELESRISILDKELEASLKASYLEEIASLREKAEPKREGGKSPRGKLGHEAHRFFDAVANVAGLNEKEVEGRRAEIHEETARLDAAGELTPALAADLFEQEQTLDMFGALNTKNAAHLARALDLLQDVYDNGRNRWRIQEEARQEEVRGLIADTVKALGGVSRKAIQKQKDKADKALSIMKSGQWSIKSFTETMELLFGRNHVLALRWSRMVREGFAQRTNEIVALTHRWRDAMHRATGLKGRKARHAVWEMAHKQTIQITAQPFTSRSEEIPVETFAKILAGEADATALGLSAADVDTLTAQFDALPADSRKGNLTLRRVTEGTAETIDHTEAEGIFLSMLYAQAAYRDALARAGYSDAVMAEMEKQLTPAAQELRAFLRDEYRDGYEPLAQVFRRMFGVDLPAIENYSPGAFYHTGGNDASVDPFGPVLPDGGFRASFLKDRKPHTAAPRAQSAFSTFFGHANQAAHWKALGEVTRELRAVFGNPDVKQALTGRHGEEAQAKVSEWMGAIEGNGIAARSTWLSRTLFSFYAHSALAYNVLTIMKQSTALLGAWYKMPTTDYLKGLALWIAGRALKTATLGKVKTEFQEDVEAMWRSDIMQRRIVAGFSPEVRAVFANNWNTRPHWRNAFLERGMEYIGLVDAWFTTGSAAISYNYHFRHALKAGQSEAAARRIAENEAADMVARTAQPVETVDRSLVEQSLAAAGIGRAVMMFASESRQKSSLYLSAWGHILDGKPTTQDFRVLFISHFIVGPIIQAITGMFKDATDDDDSDDDIEHWEPGDFLKAAALTPLQGIPVVRDILDGFSGESGPLSSIYYGFGAGKQLLNGPEDSEPEKAEWYAKKVAQILKGIPHPFTAVAARIGDQAFKLGDNLFDDEIERGMKQLKKEDAERDALRESATTDEQDKQRREHLAREREAKIRAAAQRVE